MTYLHYRALSAIGEIVDEDYFVDENTIDVDQILATAARVGAVRVIFELPIE